MKLTKAQRDLLSEADFADPANRLFAIVSQDDLDLTARVVDRTAADPDAVKGRAATIARRKGLAVPEGWGAAAMSAEFTEEETPDAQLLFDLSAEFAEDGDFVIRDAPIISRVGDYDFKGKGTFSLTPEDFMATVADFTDPLKITDTHATVGQSVFDKKGLGEVVELTPTADFSSFGGRVKVPRWLDTLFQGEPLKLSAHWDWETKRLKHVSLVDNPRIPEAAMFAAFAADQMQKTGRHVSPHGQALMQHVHDMTAKHGAVCSTGDKSSAEFMAEHEVSAAQKIHDLTLGSGAACALYRENVGKTQTQRPGQYYDSTVDLRPMYRDYRPGQYASMSDEEEVVQTTPPAPAKPASPAPARPAPRRAPAVRDPEKERLQAQLKQEQTRRIAAEAATFAQEVSADNRCIRYQVPGIVLEYQQAAHDDATLGGTAAFSDESGETKQGSRVDAVKARWRQMPQHQLTEEQVQDDAVFAVVGNRQVTNQGGVDLEEARRSAEAYAASKGKHKNGRG